MIRQMLFCSCGFFINYRCTAALAEQKITSCMLSNCQAFVVEHNIIHGEKNHGAMSLPIPAYYYYHYVILLFF